MQPSYPSLAAALTDLNLITSYSTPGTIFLRCTGGNSETAPPTGLIIGSASLNPLLSATNTITINTAGGTATINAGVGTATPASAAPDGMISIRGADYVTIDGLTLTDGNASNPATMEFGIALFKASLSDGSQNITIKNCILNMQRINNASSTAPMVEGSVGILVINSTATAAITSLTPTTAAGTNSNNKFYTNAINSGNYGIALSGFAASSPFTAGDTGNDIGGSSLITGNTILNFGGAASAANPSAGIRANNQWELNISYNTVNNNNGSGVNHVTTLRGIYGQAGTSANATISNNIISLQSGATTSICTAIDNVIGSTAASNTININNNTVNVGYSTATTGVYTAISNTSTAATVNINSNTITQIASVPLAGTGTHVMIETGSPTTVNTNNNNINNITRNGASGSWRGIKTTSPTNWTANGNTIDVLSWTAVASTGSIDGIYSFSSAVNVTANNNIIRNLSTPTTGTITGINEFGSSGLKTFQNNQIYNFSTTAGGVGGATLRGISESTGTTNDISGNQIYTLNSTGSTGGTSGTIVGITFSSGTTNNVYKNKIYDLSSTSTGPVVSGITVAGGTTDNLYNNLIGDLRATAANAANSLIGINVTGGTTVNAYFNTVRLSASSTGALFGSSAISVSTSPTVTLRNNIFVNLSTVMGAGLTVAHRRSSTTLTTYAAASNNNLFYAGTPGAANLIFNDGTNSDQTLAAYKTRVAPRDASSVTENPTFLSISGASANFLHIDTTVPTQIESAGTSIAGITDDFDGNTRNVSTPDIGADEFAGVLADFTGPSINYTALPNTACATNPVFTATITDASGVNTSGGSKPRVWFKKSTNANTLPGTNDNTTDGWKYTEASNASSPFSFTIDYSLIFGGVASGDDIFYFVVAQDLASTPNLSINSGTFTATPPTVALNAGAFPVTLTKDYFILPALATTITIGASGTYTSLTGAGGFFAALNGGALSGNTTVNIMDASVTESGTNALNAVASACGGPYTLTIKPGSGVTATLTGSVASGALIKLNGADNVIIDGSNNGTSSRDLTITNSNTTSPAVIWLASVGTGAGADHNTIKNCIINTGSNAATSYGIAVAGSTLGSTGADNDNVTIQNNLIAKVYHAIWANGSASTSSGGLDNLNITNNLIGPAASGTDNIGFSGVNISNAVNPNVSSNTIRNFSATTASAGGILINSSVAGATVSQNTLTNLNSTTAILYGILVNGVTGNTFTISQNILSRITGNTSSVSGTYVTGIEVGVTALIEKNQLDSIANNHTGTWGVYGINLSAGNNHVVKNNFISNVNRNMTGGAAFSNTLAIAGIRVGAGTGHQIYHNSVNLYGVMPGTASSNMCSACLYIAATTSTGCDIRNNIFSNTMTGGTTSIAHVAVNIPTSGTSAMNLTWNNNAYYTGTTAGVHGIAHVGSTYTATPAGPTTYAGLYTAANFDPTSTSGINNLRSYTSILLVANTNNDNASLGSASAAPFVSNVNLHIPAATNTQLESGGAAVGVTADIDGDTRPGPAGSVNGGATAPDIGADEFDGTPAAPMTFLSCTTTQTNVSNVLTNSTSQEVIGIQIVTAGVLNPLSVTSITANTNGTTNVADITNAKLWYTGSSSVFAATGQFGSTIAAPSGSLNFTGTQTLASGTNYFWLTYDVPCSSTAGNVVDAECSTLTVGSPHTPTIVAPAGSRTIQVGPLTGTYTVGTGGSYTTLEAAIADVNSKGLTGNTTLSILNSLTLTNPVAINQWTECPGSGYTLTISPAAATAVTITCNTGSTLTGTIKLNGADRVTIDGLNTGGASLTIENSSTTAGTAAVWISSLSAGNGATNNTVRNCIIKAGVAQNANTTSTYGIVMGGSSLSGTPSSVSAGNDNDNNTIANNTIIKARYGIYTMGGGTTNPNLGTIISNNTIGPVAFGADEIGRCGILVREENGIQILGNKIRFVGGDFANTTGAADRVAIALATDATWSSPTAVFVKNAIIANNRIQDIVEERTSSAIGILMATVDGSNPTSNVAVNNMIYNVKANGTSTDQALGIALSAGNGDGIVFNTIYMTGDADPNGSATTPTTACFGLSISSGTAVTNPTFKDNIIWNDLSSSSAPALKHADINVPTAYAWGTGFSNVNDLYINAGNVQSNTGCIGGNGGTFSLTLNDWQTNSTQDAMSVAIQPVFFAPPDLHLDFSNTALNNLGMPISGVTVDIDNETRNVSTPDMGADEFTPVSCVTAVGGTAAVTGSSTFCGSGTPVIGASGYSVGIGSTYQWYTSTNSSDYPSSGTIVAGQTNPSSLSTGIVSVTHYYWLKVTCATNSSTDYSSMVTITIVTPPTATLSPSGTVSICPPTTSQLLTTSTNASSPSYVWKKDGVTIVGATSSSYSVTVTGSYTVIITDGSTSCSSTSSATSVVFNTPPASPMASATPNPVCEGTIVNLSSSAVVTNAYSINNNCATSFVDISVTGTDVPGALGDDTEHNITIPSFNFNGIAYTTARVGVNGGIALGSTTGDIYFGNAVLPSTASSAGNILLLPYWDDLDIQTSPTIRTQTIGNIFIIQFTNLAHNDFTTGSITFQVQLNLTTGVITYVYQDVIFGDPLYDSGVNATVGIQYSSSAGLQYSFNTASLSNGQCISFTPPALTYSWTGPGGFMSSQQNPGLGMVNTSSAGIYNVSITDNNGCASTASVSLVVNATPTITLGTNPSVCVGTTSANLPYTATTGSPNQYSIDYDATANGQGFVDVNNAPLPVTPIVLAVPVAPTLGTYNGTLTIRNSATTCSSITYPITVTILAIPNAGTVSGASPLCVGVMSTYTSSGDPGGTWTSTMPSVASVNPTTGVVTTVASGTTDITYTVSNGGNCNPVASFKTLNVSPSIVMNNADSGAGSLRDVIACVGDGATITIDGSLLNQTITLTSGEILIDKNITIIGLGAANLTISGNNASRIFHVQTGKTLELHAMALKDANSVTNGGAVFVEGTLKLQDMLLQNNFENGIPKSLTLANPSSLDVIGGNVEFRN